MEWQICNALTIRILKHVNALYTVQALKVKSSEFDLIEKVCEELEFS
jgi:hypothetical protein